METRTVNPTSEQKVKAVRYAQRQQRPCVMWWDDDYHKTRYCTLSYYENAGAAFINEKDVIAIFDEKGYRID